MLSIARLSGALLALAQFAQERRESAVPILKATTDFAAIDQSELVALNAEFIESAVKAGRTREAAIAEVIAIAKREVSREHGIPPALLEEGLALVQGVYDAWS